MALVKNNARGARTFQVKADGGVKTVTLEAGESRDLDLATPDHPVIKAWVESKEIEVGGAKAAAKSDDTGGGSGGGGATSTLLAVHRGRGSFSIMDGDTEVLEGLTKADADAFSALSDEDKAKFVAARKQQ